MRCMHDNQVNASTGSELTIASKTRRWIRSGPLKPWAQKRGIPSMSASVSIVLDVPLGS